ncbi:MAG TPA: hypothetical protein VD971_11530 [Phycisphaerales bacterium]|nr:hypothetical protein [Phycisphaerales bacterium]
MKVRRERIVVCACMGAGAMLLALAGVAWGVEQSLLREEYAQPIMTKARGEGVRRTRGPVRVAPSAGAAGGEVVGYDA